MGINTIYWEITGICNLHCTHCHLGGTCATKILTKNKSLERVELLAKNGIEKLILTGGEPLTNPYVFDIMECAKEYGMDLFLLTNGTLINEKRAQKLSEINPRVQISMDGLREHHDKIRGKGVFARIETAIDNLRNVGMTPSMKLTITNHNLGNIDAVINYCKESNLFLSLSLAQDIGNVINNGIIPTPSEYFKLFEKLYQRKREENLKLNLPDFSIEEYLDTGIPKSGCSAGNPMATITKEGYYIPCIFLGGINLSSEDGLVKFSEKFLTQPNPLFTIINKHSTKEFGCPLRKLTHCGNDPYSVYEFMKYHETI